MARKLQWETRALDDLGWWIKNDLKRIKRIYELLESIVASLFDSIGKPEALKGNFSGYWSRRITEEHRIVYKVTNELVILAQLKDHYQ